MQIRIRNRLFMLLSLVIGAAPLVADYAGVIPVSVDPATKKAVMLLGLRAPHAQHGFQAWGDFGGQRDRGETMDQAARREGLEEMMIQAKSWVNPDRLYKIRETFDPAFNKSVALKLANAWGQMQINLVELPYVPAAKWNAVLHKYKNDAHVPHEAREVRDFVWVNIDDVIAWVNNTNWTAALVKGHRLYRNTSDALRQNMQLVLQVRDELVLKGITAPAREVVVQPACKKKPAPKKRTAHKKQAAAQKKQLAAQKKKQATAQKAAAHKAAMQKKRQLAAQKKQQVAAKKAVMQKKKQAAAQKQANKFAGNCAKCKKLRGPAQARCLRRC